MVLYKMFCFFCYFWIVCLSHFLQQGDQFEVKLQKSTQESLSYQSGIVITQTLKIAAKLGELTNII